MKKVLILFGGNSHEHEISCMSVNFIKQHIDINLFKYEIVGIDKNNNWYLIDKKFTINKNWINNKNKKINNIREFLNKFDVVFPMIHGNTGEDGKIQSLLELYNIKYVGCNSYSSFICYDKLLTKIFLEKFNITQVPYIIYTENMNYKKLEYPLIIKPCKSGSSIGITIANNKKELIKAIKTAKKYDNNILIEKYIKNKKELECAILQNKNKLIISDVGEIITKNSFYDFNSKYINQSKTIISDIDHNIKTQVQNQSKKIFKLLNCKNISRIDFLYDLDDKKLYFNEINTMPGFTKISMYPTLINNVGINYKKLITLLINS